MTLGLKGQAARGVVNRDGKDRGPERRQESLVLYQPDPNFRRGGLDNLWENGQNMWPLLNGKKEK